MSKKQKRHGYDKLLSYMHLLEEGYSAWSIHRQYGINAELLKRYWASYRRLGEIALQKKKRRVLSPEERLQAIEEFENNRLTLLEVLIKYDISETAFYTWRQEYSRGRMSLIGSRVNGRPPKDMGRPKKKSPEEMTELERLRYENERLRAENALLKKVKALVKEREARLREIGRKPSKD